MLMAENLLLMRRRYRTSVSAAALFLAAYGPLGMVLDFADASVAIVSSGGSLDYQSQGQVSNGALVGPGAKLTNTAPSLKLTEQADGNLGFQAHNLCLQSENLSLTWTTTNASVSASTAPPAPYATSYKITETAATGVHIASQAITGLISGATYRIEVAALAAERTYIGILDAQSNVGKSFDISAGTVGSNITAAPVGAGISSAGGGFYRCYIDIVATTTAITVRLYTMTDAATVSFAGTLGSGVVVTGVHVRRTPSASDYIATTTAAAYDLPYVYSSGVRTGIMVEPAATNVLLRSTEFDNASWTKLAMTVTANAALAPDGTFTADLIIPTAASTTHYIFQAVTTTAAAWTFSAFVQAGGLDFLQISDGVSGTDYINFNLQTGAIGNAVGYTGTIAPAPNGYYRITATKTFTAVSTEIRINPLLSDVAIRRPTFLGDGINGVYIRDAQIETGTVATSPIITYGSTVLRAADNLSMLTGLFPFDAAIGTLFVESQLFYATGGAGFTNYLRIDDGTVNNRIAIYRNGSNTSAGLDVTTGGAGQGPVTRTATALNSSTRLSGAYAANDLAFVIDGGAVGADGTASMAASYTTLRLGRDTTGTPDTLLNGMITRVAYFPRRFSDAELQAVTA